MATRIMDAEQATSAQAELEAQVPNGGTEPSEEPAEQPTATGSVNPRENVQVGAPTGYRKVVALALHIAEDASEELDGKIAAAVAAVVQSEADASGLTLDVEQLKHHFILTLETEASAAAKASRKSVKAPKAPKELTADDGQLLFNKINGRAKELLKDSTNVTRAQAMKQAREEVAAAHNVTVERLKELIEEYLGV